MKQKITLMKQRLDLSDEEINSYMDFDSLRRKQRELDIKKRNRYAILKWSVPVLLLISSAIWFFLPDDNTFKVSNPKQQIESALNPSTRDNQEEILAKDSVKSETSNVVLKEKTLKLPKEEVLTKKNTQSIEKSSVESIYIQAEPIEGYPSLYAYLNAQLQYPAESLKDSIQGVQTISFVINVEGKPEQIQFVESLGASFESESKRLIESMQAWKPATLNGKPVPSKLVLPLTFQVQMIKAKE